MNACNLLHGVTAGTAGTSTMTLFSYMLSRSAPYNFREPRLLGSLLKNILISESRQARLAGWMVHFLMGGGLAIVFQLAWKKRNIKPTLKTSLLFGACSGITAIIWWHTAFLIHPHPPKVAYKRFYIHLVLAHLIYSITVAEISKRQDCFLPK